MAIQKERSCVWCIQLYPDNERHVKALELIEKNYREYAWIKHTPESTEKKEHIHVVIRFKNYRWNTALAEELDIELNMFEKCRGLDNALLYLLHFREPDKIQYTLDDVHGFFNRRLERLVHSDGKDSTDKAYDIVSFIKTQGNVSYEKLFEYCAQNGLYGELLRGINLFGRILDERNRNKYDELFEKSHINS